jgi:hypothetical protein
MAPLAIVVRHRLLPISPGRESVIPEGDGLAFGETSAKDVTMRPCRELARLAALALALLLGAPAAAAAEAGFVSPLQPLDTSSPRATMQAVTSLGAEFDAAYAAYLADPSFAGQRAIRQVLARTGRLFDLTGTLPAL